MRKQSHRQTDRWRKNDDEKTEADRQTDRQTVG